MCLLVITKGNQWVCRSSRWRSK